MQAKTFVEFCTDIFNGNVLEIEGSGKAIVRVSYPEISSGPTLTGQKEVKIEVERDGDIKSFTLIAGDEFIFNHSVFIKATKDITDKHPFPITFTMGGQTYKLNRTKQNKLILTK